MPTPDAQNHPVAILGGGVAGLAAGLSAHKLGLPFHIFEKAAQAGGNCVTFSHNGFRFDSGAHRVHDRDADATRQLRQLLGQSLKQINVPSQIYHKGMFLTFPFKIGDLARKLGWHFLAGVAGEVLRSHLHREPADCSFASREQRNYGPTLAGLFLLNYSQKLWGMPCDQLSVEISGNRLAGLNLMNFLKESILPQRSVSKHLEGAFYYPEGGIGAISDALANGCGQQYICTNAQISRVYHNRQRITAVEINNGETVACAAVINSIPLDCFVQLLDPPAPPEVLHIAATLRFRQLALVAIFLNQEKVTSAATLYFPDSRLPFTRLYEPKNRSAAMAPPGKTSLIAEIPYEAGSPYESMVDEQLIELVRNHVVNTGLIAERDLESACVRRMTDAYPVLTKGVEAQRRVIFAYLRKFTNLKPIGRNGTFRYLHIHHLLSESAQAVAELCLGEAAP